MELETFTTVFFLFLNSFVEINDTTSIIRVLTYLHFLILGYKADGNLTQLGLILLIIYSGSMIFNFFLTDSIPCMHFQQHIRFLTFLFYTDWISSYSIVKSYIIAVILFHLMRRFRPSLFFNVTFQGMMLFAVKITFCSEVLRYCFLIDNMQITHPNLLDILCAYVVAILPLHLFHKNNKDRQFLNMYKYVISLFIS